MPIVILILGVYFSNKNKMDVAVNLFLVNLKRMDALLILGLILFGIFILWVFKLHFEYREYYEEYINYEQILMEYEEKAN